MVVCPKCNAPEHSLRWQFQQGSAFRCTLCNYTFISEIKETEYADLKSKNSSPPSGSIFRGNKEPLLDIFEEKNSTKIYVEIPGENINEIWLNIMKSQVEITTRHYYKLINLPSNSLELKMAYYKYRNGVLEIIIPKKENLLQIMAVQ